MNLMLMGGAFDFLKPIGDLFFALRLPFEFLLRILYNALAHFGPAEAIGAYGLSIVLLTIIVKTLLFPLFQTQLKLTKKTQAEQRKVAPELAEIRKKYKKDPQKLNTEMMALYKAHGINPLSPMIGCLPTLAQLPILLGLYRAFYDQAFLHSLHASSYFLGLNLTIPAGFSNPVTWILPVLAGFTTFVQSKMVTPPSSDPNDTQAAQMAQVSSTMSLMMPLFIIYLSFQKFALQGLVLYWIVSNLFSIFQQYTVNGWGQLPILGSRAAAAGGGGGSDVSGGKGDSKSGSSGNGKSSTDGKTKGGKTSSKVLVGQAELSGRRNRRR